MAIFTTCSPCNLRRSFFRMIILGTVLLLMGVSVLPLRAQVDLRINLQPTITQSQSLNFSDLLTSQQGPHVATFFISNNTNQVQEDLYLRILVKSTNVGVIADLEQRDPSFSLKPNQSARATNNDLHHGIPNVTTNLAFDGGLTTEGENFITSLKGQTSLPDDVYSIEIRLLQNGEVIASTSESLGEEPMSVSRDIYMNSPGGEVESGVDFVIPSNQPQFDWSGNIGETYRIVVVKASGSENEESLIQRAKTTDPILENTRSVGGTLLESEMADILQTNSSFRYPSSGVKKLRPGQKYYWQVTTLVETTDGQQEITSEIWAFKVASRQQDNTGEISRRTQQQLQTLLGDQYYSLVEGQNMDLQSVVIDGQRYSGPAMIKIMSKLMERARRGEITIVND